MAEPDVSLRRTLPIPDVAPIGLTTFDAKDPDTAIRRSCRCVLRLERRTCWWC